MKKLFLSCFILSFFSVYPLQVNGDELVFEQGHHNINDIVTALAPDTTSQTYKTRGIKSAVKVQTRAISLAIHFKKDSYKLTPEALDTLNSLGKALNKKRLKEFNFIVEGHTDAAGTDKYNLHLSKQRSAAVKNFLVAKHRINANRLISEGKGEKELCDNSNPYSGVNRRVRIINNGR